MRMGPMELVLILLIVFFIFGAKRLPEMGKGIGEAIRGFKSSIKDDGTDTDTEDKKKHA